MSRISQSAERKTPFSQAEELDIALGLNFFCYFLDNVFIKSFVGREYWSPEQKRRVPFKFGPIHYEWALLAQYSPRLCLQASRAHLKTTVLGQAFPFWLMAKAPEGSFIDGV